MRFNCIATFMIVVGCLLGGCSQSRSASEVALDRVWGMNDLRGKVVLVQFGMVGCPVSDAGLKQMIAMQSSSSRGNLHFLRVECGVGGENEAAVASYYQTTAPPFPVYRDPQGTLAQAVKATAVPCCILVDSFGHIRYRGRFPEQQQLGEWVAQLAAERTDPGSDASLFGSRALEVSQLLRQTTLPEVSQSAPPTAARPLNNYMGQAGLLVIFVDTHCPFSAEAMQDVPKITPILASLKIPTVMVNLDDDAQDVQKHYAAHAYGVPVLYDTTTKTKDKWGIESVPTLIYITANEQVGYNGVAVWKELADAVEKNLKVPAGTIQFAPKGTGFG